MKPTQEQVIEWAREAGFYPENAPEMNVALERLAMLAYEAGRSAENDVCAEIADQHRNNMQFLASNPPQSAAAYDIARAIRARREQ